MAAAAPRPTRFLGVDFTGQPKKVVHAGRNKFCVHGEGLDLWTTPPTPPQTLTVQIKKRVSGGKTYEWEVDATTVRINRNFVRFEADLTVSRGAGGDSGDLIITLDYSEEPTLEITCPEVEYP